MRDDLPPSEAGSEENSAPSTTLEMLAAVTDEAGLAAAIEAGADAILFQVTHLNSRRRVGSFRPEQLRRAVQRASERGARSYLALDLDLAESELGHAIGLFDLAKEVGIAAMLIRDPALLALRPEYPELEIHLTTSRGMANSADVTAAKELGVTRVALAHDLSLGEIAATAAVSDVAIAILDPAGSLAVDDVRRVGLAAMAIRPTNGHTEQEPDPEGVIEDADATYRIEILLAGKQVQIRCECRDHVVQWTIPKTVVRRPHKAIPVGKLLEYLEITPQREHWMEEGLTDDPDFLLVPRASNNLISRISTVIQQAVKKDNQPSLGEVSPAVAALLEPRDPEPVNRRTPADLADRVRLDAQAAESFLAEIRPEGGIVVEGATVDQLREIHHLCRRMPLVVALPAVFYEEQIPEIQDLLQVCAKLRTVVEVNSWGGWHLARATGLRLESGPGLPVLNTLAARTLADHQIQSVMLSSQLKRRQLEELTAHCPVSCSLTVFGRLSLQTSRTEPTSGSRQVSTNWRCERGLWVARPREPFNLRGGFNTRIQVRHLVVDLVASPNPIAEWYAVSPASKLETKEK